MRNRKEVNQFLCRFSLCFAILYGLNIAFIGLSTPGGLYLPWFDQYLNYIKIWRNTLVSCTAYTLRHAGFIVKTNPVGLNVKDHSGFRLVYSCLGYGITSAFVAFVTAFPGSRLSKYLFAFTGILQIQILNIIRLCLISVLYRPDIKVLGLNYHDIFNYFLYAFTAVTVYLWTINRHKN